MEIDDPSKVILTLSKAIINIMEVVSTGQIIELDSWDHVRKELQRMKKVKRMNVFERLVRQNRYK